MAPTGKTQRANKAAKTSAGQSQQLDDSPAPSPGSVSDSVPLISPGSPTSQDGDSTDLDPLADADIRRHIMSLPTKADLERFADRVEKAFKEDIAQLKADTNHLGGRNLRKLSLSFLNYKTSVTYRANRLRPCYVSWTTQRTAADGQISG